MAQDYSDDADLAAVPPQHLFVYGTLMSASAHPMAQLLLSQAERIGEAFCQGRLYQVVDYPGLVASTDAADRVFGELFRFRRPDPLLTELDAYEGCGPHDPKPTPYLRVSRAVILPDQTSVSAWVYLYNRPVTGLRRIVSGRFLER